MRVFNRQLVNKDIRAASESLFVTFSKFQSVLALFFVILSLPVTISSKKGPIFAILAVTAFCASLISLLFLSTFYLKNFEITGKTCWSLFQNL